MNLAEFRAQLEEELAWRIEEVLFFQNQCAFVEIEVQRDQFRRALVLLLYSNFEGLCKFALSLYVSAVNLEDVNCKDANFAIVAASLSDVFAALRNATSKAREFKNDVPDDAKLHRFARDREFVERAFEIMARKVVIPEDAVDMESNLNPIVLRKNLYRLGLPHDQFASIEPNIHQLLNLRNKIAHGETRQGISAKLYEQLRDSSFHVMNEIASGVTQAFEEKWFLLKRAGTGSDIAEAVA